MCDTQGLPRRSTLDVGRLDPPAALVFNPQAVQKLGVTTNADGAGRAREALRAAGVPFEAFPTEHAGHAIDLAHEAVRAGRRLVVACGNAARRWEHSTTEGSRVDGPRGPRAPRRWHLAVGLRPQGNSVCCTRAAPETRPGGTAR